MIVNRCFGCMEETSSYPCPHCGYLHQEQKTQGYALQPGTILHGKYLIGKVLGQGGFGITYIGWDLALARKVAIKEYFPAAHVSRDTNITMDIQWYHTEQAQEAMSSGQEMFLKEARKMNTVASIPQVVHVQDIFQDNCTSYIVMDYIHGETLAARISRTGPITWQTVQSLLLPIAGVMQQVHNVGLIHRDLSPDNVMLLTDGTIKILDLGAAKDMNLRSGASSMQVAKGGFSPMEQYVMRGNSGPWTDVYSLAATIYFALTGVVPPSAVERMDKDTLRWNLPQLQNVPAPVISHLQKAMAVQIKDRIQSMDQFIQGFQNPKPRRNRKPWAAIGAVAAVAVLGLVIGLSGAPKENAPASDPTTAMEATTEAPSRQDTSSTKTNSDLWVDNVLMSATITSQYEYDEELSPVFNSRIIRAQIVSVTFLDSLDTKGPNAWDVSQAKDGSVMAWTEPNGTVSVWRDSASETMDGYDLYIAAENGINAKYCNSLFHGYFNVTSIRFNGAFHTDYAEDMEDMFAYCYDLKYLDETELVTDQVRTMRRMFASCPLEKLDVSNFNTSNVVDMESMFYSCNKLTSLDLSNFDTTKVTSMMDMFCLCSSLTDLDISSFDTSSVTDMSFMFSFTGLKRLDLSHFDTSKVTTMSYMFASSKDLVSVDSTGFNTSKVTSMSGTFNECVSLEEVRGLENWDTSKVEYHDNFLNEDVLVDGEPWITLFQ